MPFIDLDETGSSGEIWWAIIPCHLGTTEPMPLAPWQGHLLDFRTLDGMIEAIVYLNTPRGGPRRDKTYIARSATHVDLQRPCRRYIGFSRSSESDFWWPYGMSRPINVL